jgi:hypothetical protein
MERLRATENYAVVLSAQESARMIHLGFEIGSGRPIAIPNGHLAITGQSQSAGKTTTLEALISRAGSDAVAFLTKRGEGSFLIARNLPPYFKDRTDWPFIRSILEARAGEKLRYETAQIINLCQDYSGPEGTWRAPRTLADVLANAELALKSKVRGFVRNVYVVLCEYLREVVPGIEALDYTKTLELEPGLNVMDLIPFEMPLQALIIRSALEWVHSNCERTVVIVPEAWKFTPRRTGTPVRFAAEEYIRQGAALENFLWLDSQDMASVSAPILRQVKIWLFGVQRASDEIERTLSFIPADIRKPSKGDIARLGIGQFIVCFERAMFRVYVQPVFLSSAHAEAVARGEETLESVGSVFREFDAL